MLVNETGAVTDRYSFDAYGMRLAGEANVVNPAASDLGYSGEQFDSELGWNYHRARYLDMGVGRWNRVDPFLGARSAPESLHSYAYAYLNPLLGSDPTGMMNLPSTGTMIELLVAFEIITVLQAALLPAIVSASMRAKERIKALGSRPVLYYTYPPYRRVFLAALNLLRCTLPRLGFPAEPEVSFLEGLLITGRLLTRERIVTEDFRGFTKYDRSKMYVWIPDYGDRYDADIPASGAFHPLTFVGALAGTGPRNWPSRGSFIGVVGVASVMHHEYQHFQHRGALPFENVRWTKSWFRTFGQEWLLLNGLRLWSALSLWTRKRRQKLDVISTEMTFL